MTIQGELDLFCNVGTDGTVLPAARYTNASAEGIDLLLGLGSRHLGAASITQHTNLRGPYAVRTSEQMTVASKK